MLYKLILLSAHPEAPETISFLFEKGFIISDTLASAIDLMSVMEMIACSVIIVGSILMVTLVLLLTYHLFVQ